MFVIKPIGGLCNYLRVILSYNQLAKKYNEKLLVHWEVTPECNGKFHDYFLDVIPNVQIVYEYSGTYNYKGYSIYENLFPDFTHIKPTNSINKKINDFVNNKEFIAIHVRRTDHTKLMKKENKIPTSDEDFFNFCDNSTLPIFLATDSIDTQRKFIEKYGDRILFWEKLKKKKVLRKTELEIAVLDLFTCVLAKEFKGSYYSSFSDTILQIRNEVLPY